MSDQKVIIGNSLNVLKTLPSESIDVCVTSPPYWGLRDYGNNAITIWGGKCDCEHDWNEHIEPARGGCGNANVGANKDFVANNRGHPTITDFCSKCGAWRGQLGLEPNPLDYIEHLCMIFDEVWRVLKPTGACWVNIGDTYATVSGSDFQTDNKASQKVTDAMLEPNEIRKTLKDYGFQQKSLCQIPSRFAIAMTDRGWILRNSCIWYKPNPMPISVKDRFTNDYEMFYFFVKQQKYYFKQQFEPIKEESIARAKRAKHNTLEYHDRISGTNPVEMKHNDPNWQRFANPNGRNCRSTWEIEDVNTSKWDNDEMESSVRQGMNCNRGKNLIYLRKNLPEHKAFVDFIRSRTSIDELSNKYQEINRSTIEHWFRYDDCFSYPTEEHWLTVRESLDDGSEQYKSMDYGLTDITVETDAIDKNNDGMRNCRTTWNIPTKGEHYCHIAMFPEALIERPIDSCCPEGGTVIDPFCGSGTVLAYCRRKNIKAIGIDINPDNEKIMVNRMNRAKDSRIKDLTQWF